MVDPLKGIQIVSFTHSLFGPMGVQALADLGADVITIELLSSSWQSVLFLSVDRNKQSIAIDLKSPRGLQITRKIIASAHRE